MINYNGEEVYIKEMKISAVSVGMANGKNYPVPVLYRVEGDNVDQIWVQPHNLKLSPESQLTNR